MKAAVVFPGQGSQQVGMGKFLFENFSFVRHLFEEASDAIHFDLKKLCFYGPEDELTLTENTQPALLLVSTATFEVLKEEYGFSPELAAGHSVGEYAALVTSGVLDFADGVRAVRRRGQAMQSAVPPGVGGMCAVMGMSEDDVRLLCAVVRETTGRVLEPANFNCPGQVVISGHKDAIEWLTAHAADLPEPLKGKRVKAIPLKVSAPFHCSLMEPAEAVMSEFLADVFFASPLWPVIQNVTAETAREPLKLKQNVIKQISGAVRWSESYSLIPAHGIEMVVECGSGKVLSGLAKKILPDGPPLFTTSTIEEMKSLGVHLTQKAVTE